MNCLFPDNKREFFETPEYGGIDTVGYQCRWEQIVLDFIVSLPCGLSKYGYDLLEALERPLKFGDREQINALKAWALCSAMPAEKIAYM